MAKETSKATEPEATEPEATEPEATEPEVADAAESTEGDYTESYPDHDFTTAAITRAVIRGDAALVVTLVVPAKSGN